MKQFLPAVLAFALWSMPLHAASLTGIWETEPDGKAQTGHVSIHPCGAALCGTVLRAFDKSGKPVSTPAVGKRILSDVKANGSIGEGKVYVPLMRNEFPVRLVARGNALNLKACNALGICRTQVWQRVN